MLRMRKERMTNQFAKRITKLRKQNGLSQKAAAAQLDISQGLLSHYEKGIRECGLDFVIKAANFYHVSCGYLLGVEQEQEELPGNAQLRSTVDLLCESIIDLNRFTFARGGEKLCMQLDEALLYYLYHIFRVLETGSDEFMKKFTISRQCALLNSHARYAAALARLSEQAQETAGQAGWSSLSDRLIKLAEDGLQVQ